MKRAAPTTSILPNLFSKNEEKKNPSPVGSVLKVRHVAAACVGHAQQARELVFFLTVIFLLSLRCYVQRLHTYTPIPRAVLPMAFVLLGSLTCRRVVSRTIASCLAVAICRRAVAAPFATEKPGEDFRFFFFVKIVGIYTIQILNINCTRYSLARRDGSDTDVLPSRAWWHMRKYSICSEETQNSNPTLVGLGKIVLV